MIASDPQSLARATEPAPRALVDGAPSWALLTAGAVITLLTGARHGIAALAWLMPVPYLLFARRVRSWRGWLALAGVVIVASTLQWLQIVTPPVPALMILGFAVPMSAGAIATLALTEVIRRRAGEVFGLYAFAALTAIGDWASYAHTEVGAWASVGNANVTSLPILQLASLAGLAGLGFLMGWLAGVVASLAGAPEPRQRWRHACAVAVVLVAALGWGSLRLDDTHERTVTVAAVVTDLGLDERGLPSAAELAANTETLFERTRLAAARGARLVVWNEVAAVVEPAEEPALLSRGRAEARRLGVDLVLGYGVLAGRAPLLFDNKYAFVTSEGTIAETYRKHHPVPGEPSMRGTEPLDAIERPYARVAGAICYDYDFPAMARAHARLGAELVVVPSSDWRGIDPVHTYMARARAVEGGFSVVRAVRWGASAAFDARGRTRALMPVTEANERVMLASVPVGRTDTLYAALGDAPVVGVSGAFLAFALVVTLRRRRPARPARRPRDLLAIDSDGPPAGRGDSSLASRGSGHSATTRLINRSS